MYFYASSYKKSVQGYCWGSGGVESCQPVKGRQIFTVSSYFFLIMFLKTKCCYITVWVWCHCKSSELSCLDDGVCGLCGLLSAVWGLLMSVVEVIVSFASVISGLCKLTILPE